MYKEKHLEKVSKNGKIQTGKKGKFEMYTNL